MSCSTCNKTMALIAADADNLVRVFACPVCGSIKVRQHDCSEVAYVPELVGRCRRLRAEYDETNFADLWMSLGIQEAIDG